MGYGNPAFHLAPYHFIVMDPNLSEEDALILYKTKGHPSRPDLWDRADLDMEDEGDLIEGRPHPSVADIREMAKIARAKKAESITVSSGTGMYTAIPSEGLVYGLHNDQVYSWAMLRNSFFAAANPELADKMNEVADAQTAMEEEISHSEEPAIPELVKHVAATYIGEDFDDDVYPLVKSHFPAPSSIVPVESTTGETLYGVLTTDSLDFYNREGSPVNVSVYDIPSASFDLHKGGNIFSSVLYTFGSKYFGITPDLSQYVGEDAPIVAPSALESSPTAGLDALGGDFTDSGLVNKSVVVEADGTFRLVVE